MTPAEHRIFEALVELEQAVARMAQSNPKPNLTPLFARIDELALDLPEGTAPELVHYLRRKSYQKALLWLQGRNAENARGSCGH